jgi:hypothetical protein
MVILTTACGSDSPRTGFLSPGTGGVLSSSAGAGGMVSPPAGTGGVVVPAGSGGRLATGGSGATPAASGGSSGSPGAGGVISSGGATSHPDASAPGSDSGADASTGSTGVLPPVKDPSVAGPFTPAEPDNVGPNNSYTVIAPKELGQNGIKHPILIWGPGAGSWPAIYQTMLNHFASHGFVVVSYNSTPQGPELTTGIDWVISESKRMGSPYFDKVDATKIAAGGQSAGSLATFKIAKDPRLTTTLHINGGTFAPHTDVMNLVKPAQFICGDDPAVSGGDGTSVSDLARPNCDIDFMNATTPVWYGDVIGASHTTVIDNPLSATNAAANPLTKHFLGATVAWLRWQLAGDETEKALFVGPNCGYCMQTMAWKVQQKNLQ